MIIKNDNSKHDNNDNSKNDNSKHDNNDNSKDHEYINCDKESCNGNYICPDDDTSKCYKNDKGSKGNNDDNK